jgi:hypothetical protein
VDGRPCWEFDSNAVRTDDGGGLAARRGVRFGDESRGTGRCRRGGDPGARQARGHSTLAAAAPGRFDRPPALPPAGARAPCRGSHVERAPHGREREGAGGLRRRQRLDGRLGHRSVGARNVHDRCRAGGLGRDHRRRRRLDRDRGGRLLHDRGDDGRRGGRDDRGRSGRRLPRGQERERVDVSLLLRGDADAEVDVRLGGDGIGARAGEGDDRPLGDGRATGDECGRELEERDGQPVGGLDRQAAAALRQRAGEGDDAGGGSAHLGAGDGADVDAAVVTGDRLGEDREEVGTEHGPVCRPRPAERGRSDGERREHDRGHEHSSHEPPFGPARPGSSDRFGGRRLRGDNLASTLAGRFSRFATISHRECYERRASTARPRRRPAGAARRPRRARRAPPAQPPPRPPPRGPYRARARA